MKFCNNLKLIISILNCNNIELSYASNLDPTITSRFKNGSRIPTQGTQTFDSLVRGLCSLTIEKNKSKEITNLCGNDELYSSISSFLINNSSDIRLKKDNNTLIGYNLEVLMKSLNVTNVMLSKYLNKDSSLISKYKKEKRYIIRNDNLVNEICNYFTNYIKKNRLNNYTSTLLKINDTSNLNEEILNFLFTKQEKSSKFYDFLENLNNFKINESIKIPDINTIVPSNILNDNKNIYIGTNEFRNSIKRFLGNVSLNNPRTLYLYSDESMKWMVDDKNFYNIWRLLMINVLIKKNRIKIVHNINRNTNELFKAIESWLPLYMTGLIEPYYNTKRSNNFKHTLFIADELAVVNSFSISNKNSNIYNYSKDKNIISNYKKHFFSLLDDSKPLVKIYIKNDINDKLNKNDYLNYSISNLDNIAIKFKEDESEVLVLKTDIPKILFEFTHPTIINTFKHYINNK